MASASALLARHAIEEEIGQRQRGAFVARGIVRRRRHADRAHDRARGEIGIEACFAGYFGVPLILVQGDEAGCQEAEAQFPVS